MEFLVPLEFTVPEIGWLDFIVPDRISPNQWDDVTTILVWLWTFVGCMILFAGNLLLAHGIIPSLTSSRDLPMRFASLRPIFFAVSGAFLLVAIFCFAMFVINLQVLYDIYDRVWI